MKRRLRMFGALSIFLLISAAASLGQQKQPAPDQDVLIERERMTQGPGGPPPPGNTFFFVESEINFDGKLVKGSPYSAQAITETTQTLSDGNRITNKSFSSFYRDSEGRTRREHTLKNIGSFATATEALQTVFINDPVAGVSYSLDPRAHVAYKSQSFRLERAPVPGSPNGSIGFRIQTAPAGGGPQGPGLPGDVFTLRTSPPPQSGGAQLIFRRENSRADNVVTQSLGKEIVEGVEAEGTRTTFTIPADEIGNERPIEIVDERWYSADLQTVVMTRHSDPRSGEVVYRLTNISRSEPARSLFEVPADYTVKEEPVQRWRAPRPPDEQ